MKYTKMNFITHNIHFQLTLYKYTLLIHLNHCEMHLI